MHEHNHAENADTIWTNFAAKCHFLIIFEATFQCCARSWYLHFVKWIMTKSFKKRIASKLNFKLSCAEQKIKFKVNQWGCTDSAKLLSGGQCLALPPLLTEAEGRLGRLYCHLRLMNPPPNAMWFLSNLKDAQIMKVNSVFRLELTGLCAWCCGWWERKWKLIKRA